MKNKTNLNCSICNCKFSLSDEGGINGFFGTIPVAFCPDCLSNIYDMTEQLNEHFNDSE